MAASHIRAARRRVYKTNRGERPSRVITELSFGFWTFLLSRKYEASLWTGALRHSFPNLQPQERAVAYSAMQNLHTVRNRIAHHEPIYQRDLRADAADIASVLRWVNPVAERWEARRNVVPRQLDLQPEHGLRR